MAKKINLMLLILMLLLACLSLYFGSSSVAVLKGFWDWVMGLQTDNAIIISEVRLPRTLLALGVGAALGISGAALQGLLRNPLVDPGLVGASQGAALGAAGFFYFGLFSSFGTLAISLAGLAGAAIALLLVLVLSSSGRPALVIMAGLAISTLASAALATVLNFAPNPYAIQELVFWLLGSVSNRGMDSLYVLLPALVVGSVLLLQQKPLLASLSLGEQVAESMGINVTRGSRLVVLGVAILVGSSVAVAGGIGFVGLVVPHMIRPFVDYRPEKLLVPSALLGAALVCLADIGVRWMPPGRELKLGVLTALIGAPFFVWLVWRERKRWV